MKGDNLKSREQHRGVTRRVIWLDLTLSRFGGANLSPEKDSQRGTKQWT